MPPVIRGFLQPMGLPGRCQWKLECRPGSWGDANHKLTLALVELHEALPADRAG